MARAERLLQLMQSLRRFRQPVSGVTLAHELGISLRTLYRDIASLQAQGACIEGEPGLGYVLRPGFTLPPLMFSPEEIEALTLGSRWVAERADSALADAARNALSKIAAVLPSELRHELDTSALLIGPEEQPRSGDQDLAQVRRAIRLQRKLEIRYLDLKDIASTRTIWPFAIGFFDGFRMLVAWCELRQDIRNFRADRITELRATDERYPRHRQSLLKAWQQREGIPAQ